MSNKFVFDTVPERPGVQELNSFLKEFFEKYAPEKYDVSTDKFGRKERLLKEFLFAGLYKTDLEGQKLSQSASYRYLDFDLADAQKIEGRKANSLWLFQQYLNELMKRNQKPKWANYYIDPLVEPFKPATRWKSFKVFDLRPDKIAAIAKDPVAKNDVVKAPDIKIGSPVINHETPKPTLPKLKYNPSLIRSTALSVLLGGISRFALVSVCSTAGLSVLPAAVIAGIGVGIITSAYKNRENIKAEMKQIEGGWRKAGAFFKGSLKSQGFYHLLFNGVAAGLGCWGADAIADLWCENQEMKEALGAAQDKNLGLTAELESANQRIESLEKDFSQAQAGNQMLVDENERLTNKVEMLETKNKALMDSLDHLQGECNKVCEAPEIQSPILGGVKEIIVPPPFDYSQVVNAEHFLNGKAGDDLSLVQNFIDIAKENGGVDSALITEVESKLSNEGVRFIVTEDSVKVVNAYSGALKDGLTDGALTSVEYSSALHKLFEQLSTADFVASGDRLSDASAKVTALAASADVFSHSVFK